MASKSRGRTRDSLLNPLNWVKRSRSSSLAARDGTCTSATSQAKDTSRLKVSLRASSHRPPLSQTLSTPNHPQYSPHPTVTTPEPVITVPDAPKSPPLQSSSLWSQAFRNANDTTQKWLKEQGLGIQSSNDIQLQAQVKEMISLMTSKEFSENVSEPLAITIANRKIIVREYLADAIGFVTMVGDAAIVFAPPQASVPWAVAKSLMNVCQYFPLQRCSAGSEDHIGQAHLAASMSAIEI